jgi:purine-cytosine permease-like protein
MLEHGERLGRRSKLLLRQHFGVVAALIYSLLILGS